MENVVLRVFLCFYTVELFILDPTSIHRKELIPVGTNSSLYYYSDGDYIFIFPKEVIVDEEALYFFLNLKQAK